MKKNRRVVTLEDLPGIRTRHKDDIIVLCTGSFDLTHAGHILFLEDCKKLGDLLVVGVGPDTEINKNKKGNRPILNEHLRLKMIDSLRPVDYSFITPLSSGKNWLNPLREIFEKLSPDIYVINSDAEDIAGRKKILKDFNIKLKILDRWAPQEFEDISTTRIIEKIKGKG